MKRKNKSDNIYFIIIFILIFIGLIEYKLAPEPFNNIGYYMMLVFIALGFGNAVGKLIKKK